MSSKHLLFHFPGHHGNFLSRMFDFASGKVDQFNIFTNNGTAHNNKKTKPHKTFKNAHPGELLGEYDNEFALTGKDVSITFSKDFVFETVYLLYKANRDRGIDLLENNQISKASALTLDRHENRNILVDPDAFDYHFDWFVYQFHVAEAISRLQPKLDYQFNVHWLYSTEFIMHLKNLLDFYNESYIHDVSELHRKFLQLRMPMMLAKNQKGSVFQSAYTEYLGQKTPVLDPAVIGPRYKHLFTKT